MTTEDKNFYMMIWHLRDHVCQSCGRRLGREPLTTYFDHLLEKKPYPQFRHTPENILLVCSDCHHKRTNGHPTEKHQAAIDKATTELL